MNPHMPLCPGPGLRLRLLPAPAAHYVPNPSGGRGCPSGPGLPLRGCRPSFPARGQVAGPLETRCPSARGGSTAPQASAAPNCSLHTRLFRKGSAELAGQAGRPLTAVGQWQASGGRQGAPCTPRAVQGDHAAAPAAGATGPGEPGGLSRSLASARGDAWGGVCCPIRRPLRSLLLDQGRLSERRHASQDAPSVSLAARPEKLPAVGSLRVIGDTDLKGGPCTRRSWQRPPQAPQRVALQPRLCILARCERPRRPPRFEASVVPSAGTSLVCCSPTRVLSAGTRPDSEGLRRETSRGPPPCRLRRASHPGQLFYFSHFVPSQQHEASGPRGRD